MKKRDEYKGVTASVFLDACCLGWESVFPLQEMHRISEMLP